jgi:hypothetical protein
VTVAQLGQVGDMFGGLNALFAALACVGVFWAGWLQRQAVLDSRKAYEMERDANEQRRLESIFFQLLTFTKGIESEVKLYRYKLSNPDVELAPHEILAETFGEHFSNNESDLSEPELDFVRESISDGLILLNEDRLHSYFKSVYQLYGFVEKHEKLGTTQDREEYAQLATAQLNSSLLTILACYGLIDHDERIKRVMELFGVLKARPAAAFTKKLLRGYLEESAFS